MIKSTKAAMWIKRMARSAAARHATLIPESLREPVDAGLPRCLSVHLEEDRSEVCRLMGRYNVFVDGDRQQRVVAFDVDKGLVVRHCLDDDGKPRWNAARTAVESEVVRGRVEVRWRAGREGGR